MATEVLVMHSERLSSCQIGIDRISEGFGELKGKWGERDKMTKSLEIPTASTGFTLSTIKFLTEKWTEKIRSKWKKMCYIAKYGIEVYKI